MVMAYGGNTNKTPGDPYLKRYLEETVANIKNTRDWNKISSTYSDSDLWNKKSGDRDETKFGISTRNPNAIYQIHKQAYTRMELQGWTKDIADIYLANLTSFGKSMSGNRLDPSNTGNGYGTPLADFETKKLGYQAEEVKQQQAEAQKQYEAEQARIKAEADRVAAETARIKAETEEKARYFNRSQAINAEIDVKKKQTEDDAAVQAAENSTRKKNQLLARSPIPIQLLTKDKKNTSLLGG